jgi:hypothetical protein
LLVTFLPAFQAGAQEEKPSAATEGETYTHIVVVGDTLWDICETLYGDPWVWPKVWQLNPHVTNPHWIYPGTELELYRELPKMTETTEAVAAVEEAAPAPELAPPPLPIPPVLPPTPEAPTFFFAEIDQVGFITPSPPPGVGVVVSERNQRILIGMGDEVFVELYDETYIGDRYYIFRTGRLILHPETAKPEGYPNSIRGVLEIVKLGADHARARVLRAYASIKRGDKLMAYSTSPKEIVLREGIEPREGRIILAESLDTERLMLIGDRQLVFIDLGEEDGIEPGHGFVVFRQPKVRNLDTGKEKTLSPEIIGKVVVLAVEPDTAAVLVTESTSELFPGDQVRLILKE